MNDFAQHFGHHWVSRILDAFDDLTDALGELDRQAGDGDFGTNIATAMKLTRQNTETLDDEAPYREWLTAVFRGFLGVGGTSGPLFGMFFREVAQCSDNDSPSVSEWAEGLKAGLGKVQYYGGAEVGQKTMVDALSPAAEAAVESANENGDAEATVRAAVEGATQGALDTADIIARRGRASYVGEAARGVIDPGAVTVATMLQSALDAVRGDEATGLPRALKKAVHG